MEQKIIGSLLQSRAAWEQLDGLLNPATELSPEGGIIYELISDYYKADPDTKKCDSDILVARARRDIQSNKIADLVANSITQLAGADISTVNVTSEIINVKRSSLGNKIASQLASGKGNAASLMHEYIELEDRIQMGSGSEGENETYRGIKASDLAKTSFAPEGLIQLYPLAVNKQLDGGLRGGHNVLVLAQTEMGKSLFVLNACYGFLKQGLKVLYIENEDAYTDTLMRMMCRLTGMTKHEILANPDVADDILTRRNWDKFILASLAPGTFPRIRQLVEEYDPAVVVINQLHNLDVQMDQRTQALEKAATEARNLAKKFNKLVISVTQAADSASGKTVLDRGDCNGSNVGIPAAMDLIIGIGATMEMEQSNWRVLSFPKQKISGNKTPISIQIDPFTSRVIE